MFKMPNPFESALEPSRVADDGHWPATADPADPVAVTFTGSSTAREDIREAPAATLEPPTAGATDDDHRFVLDEEAFLNDIEQLPAFLVNPLPEYLAAADMIPMLAVLAGH